jgi:hypothetical protein
VILALRSRDGARTRLTSRRRWIPRSDSGRASRRMFDRAGRAPQDAHMRIASLIASSTEIICPSASATTSTSGSNRHHAGRALADRRIYLRRNVSLLHAQYPACGPQVTCGLRRSARAHVRVLSRRSSPREARRHQIRQDGLCWWTQARRMSGWIERAWRGAGSACWAAPGRARGRWPVGRVVRHRSTTALSSRGPVTVSGRLHRRYIMLP